jgi:glycosyltransferase involved in cell wall biosynthesis
MPRVSVVIRSMNRLSALAELLGRVLEQQHDAFEVVVVEQTPEPTDAEQERLHPLFTDDRVRVLRRDPLGGPGARNEGVRAARGEIALLIDDDDLPLTDDWIAAHESYFADPNLVGLTGRHVRTPGEASPYLPGLQPFIRKKCLSYSFLKTPYTFARFDEDVDGTEWLHGTNSSFRREAVLEAGLWDPTVRTQDEHSLAFKLQRAMQPEQYMAFRTHPPVLRRTDLTGGMGKRRTDVRGELRNHLAFAHRIVGRYFPARFRRLYPFYLGWALARTLGWVWGDQHPRPPVLERLRDLAETVRQAPSVLRQVRREARRLRSEQEGRERSGDHTNYRS